MLMRQLATDLRPGAYLVGASPEAARLTYTQLEALVTAIIQSFDYP
jgi:hypothetical protein